MRGEGRPPCRPERSGCPMAPERASSAPDFTRKRQGQEAVMSYSFNVRPQTLRPRQVGFVKDIRAHIFVGKRAGNCQGCSPSLLLCSFANRNASSTTKYSANDAQPAASLYPLGNYCWRRYDRSRGHCGSWLSSERSTPADGDPPNWTPPSRGSRIGRRAVSTASPSDCGTDVSRRVSAI
jgi:hypothetical protein